jgi:hypothetical protein
VTFSKTPVQKYQSGQAKSHLDRVIPCLLSCGPINRTSAFGLTWRCGSIDPVETNMAETGLPYSLNNGQCMTVIETDLYPYLRETELCTEKQSEVEFLCLNVLNSNGACRDASAIQITARTSASLSALIGIYLSGFGLYSQSYKVRLQMLSGHDVERTLQHHL